MALRNGQFGNPSACYTLGSSDRPCYCSHPVQELDDIARKVHFKLLGKSGRKLSVLPDNIGSALGHLPGYVPGLPRGRYFLHNAA